MPDSNDNILARNFYIEDLIRWMWVRKYYVLAIFIIILSLLIASYVIIILILSPPSGKYETYKIILNFISSILTTATAFFGIWYAYQQYQEDKKDKEYQKIKLEKDRKDNVFIELSKRAASDNLMEVTNAITTLPIFFEENSTEIDSSYQQEAINIILNRLVYEALDKENNQPNSIEVACRDALSTINKSLLWQDRHMTITSKVLKGVYLESVDLREADLSWTTLINANLKHANLEDSNMKAIKLNSVDFTGAILDGSNFSRARIISSDFSYSHLNSAKLDNSWIKSSNFYNCKMQNTNLSNSFIEYSSFTIADIRGVVTDEVSLHECCLAFCPYIESIGKNICLNFCFISKREFEKIKNDDIEFIEFTNYNLLELDKLPNFILNTLLNRNYHSHQDIDFYEKLSSREILNLLEKMKIKHNFDYNEMPSYLTILDTFKILDIRNKDLLRDDVGIVNIILDEDELPS